MINRYFNAYLLYLKESVLLAKTGVRIICLLNLFHLGIETPYQYLRHEGYSKYLKLYYARLNISMLGKRTFFKHEIWEYS